MQLGPNRANTNATVNVSVLNFSIKRQIETKEKIYCKPVSFGKIHYAAIVMKVSIFRKV